MRLRLRIERNALPPTQAIWPVREDKTTVAQLLQHVNEVFPLEGETWGLEDYSVTVGGYECLHYHELGAVCRDEDEVVIKPLEYVEVRARTLTGRAQIAANGMHLIDGVPFGKPCLKGPTRPQIRIPPRKKRRLLEDGVEESQPELEPLMITQAGEDADEMDDDLDDEDFQDDVSIEAVSSDSSSNSDSEVSTDSSSDSDSSSSDSDSDEESWNGISGSNQSTPKKAGTGLSNGVVSDNPPQLVSGTKRKRESNADEHHSNQATPNNTEAALALKFVPPGEGISDTRKRNHRRRDAKKLTKLKELNILPPDADFAMMQEWNDRTSKRKTDLDDVAEAMAENGSGGDSPPLTAVNQRADKVKADVQPASATPSIRADPGDRASSAQPDKVSKKSKKAKKRPRQETDEMIPKEDAFEQKRQKLLSDLASGGVEMIENEEDGRPQDLSSKVDSHNHDTEGDAQQKLNIKVPRIDPATERTFIESDEVVDQAASLIEASKSARRAQLDIAGSKRILFGSLGVRVPKTQDEKDRTQKKLAERPKRNANAADGVSGNTANGIQSGTQAAAEAEAEDKDPDAWREKINLTAVECCDEGVHLSTPPFPFYQRWDPQYNKKRKRNSSKYADNSKHRHRVNMEYVESYDKYNPEGDALDYDDEDAEDEYWEDGALLGEDGERDEAESKVDDVDGFPAVPGNLNELKVLQSEEAKEGDFVVFTELACDETTAWQPKAVTRTAKLIETRVGSTPDSWVIQLAHRDLKPKVFDDEGNRVYSKFEMPDTDAEDEGIREVSWPELGAVKLILRPEAAAEE